MRIARPCHTLAAVIAAIAAFACAGLADTSAERADLEERIEALRIEGDFAGAAQLAGQVVELARSDSLVAWYEVEDAERLLKTLERVSRMPPEKRSSLARADSLAAEGDALHRAGKFAEGIVALERELELRRGVLGANHYETANTLNNLAALMWDQGDLADA